MPRTEADNAALLFRFLTAFGNVIGPGPRGQIESDRHSARLLTVLVGATAKGRKGTSAGRVRALFKLVDEPLEPTQIAGGLSTGEGLVKQVQDARWDDEGAVVDKGKSDKRFLSMSHECASVLCVMARVGNTLSPIVCDAWVRDTLRRLFQFPDFAHTEPVG
jgi:hypothetical protein